MVYEEIGTEAFPGPPQECLCRTLIPLPVGAEVAGLNYGRHRRWRNTERLLNAGDERHKMSIDEVERRGYASASIESTLSQSSTSSLAHRRHARLLEPIVKSQSNSAQSRYFHVPAPSKWRILQLDTTAGSKLLALMPQVLRRRFFR
jgi:hypothetical protein